MELSEPSAKLQPDTANWIPAFARMTKKGIIMCEVKENCPHYSEPGRAYYARTETGYWGASSYGVKRDPVDGNPNLRQTSFAFPEHVKVNSAADVIKTYRIPHPKGQLLNDNRKN